MEGFFKGSTVAAKAPQGTIPACGACGLYKACNTPKMAPQGRGGRGVLIVGGAPDAYEDASGMYHTGPQSAILRKLVGKLGYDLDEDCWTTSAAICHPGGAKAKAEGGRVPTGAEVVHCGANLRATLKHLQPKVVIPMGQAAVAAVLGYTWKRDVGTLDRWQGVAAPCQRLNAWVCPTWDVPWLLRPLGKYGKNNMDNEVVLRFWKQDINRAMSFDSRPWGTVPDWKKEVRLVLEPAKAAQYLRGITKRGTGYVAFDFETNMLKPDGPQAQIITASVAWGCGNTPERTFAFPWYKDAIPAMGELLRSPIPKIAANLKFEDRWCRQMLGHRVKGWAWDTMQAAHVLDNRPGIVGLDFQAYAHLGQPDYSDHIKPFLKSKGDQTVNQILKEIDTVDLLTYNGLDSLLEYRLAFIQAAAMDYPLA